MVDEAGFVNGRDLGMGRDQVDEQGGPRARRADDKAPAGGLRD